MWGVCARMHMQVGGVGWLTSTPPGHACEVPLESSCCVEQEPQPHALWDQAVLMWEGAKDGTLSWCRQVG